MSGVAAGAPSVHPFTRHFTRAHADPYRGLTFVARVARVTGPDGRVLAEVEGVVVPEGWSQNATDVLATKYMRRAGVPDATVAAELDVDALPIAPPEWLRPRVPAPGATFGRELDSRAVFERLAGAWTYHAYVEGYFWDEGEARAFFDECCYLLARQMMAPNSPQWFNTGLWWAYGIVGAESGSMRVPSDLERTAVESDAAPTGDTYRYPRSHACFIQSVQDNLVAGDGIMDLWDRESRVFQAGGGSGSNFSELRGEGEPLSGGGKSSGPLSFLKQGDAGAGAIKSGGVTRRAAKMVILDVDHPDIEKYLTWKLREEEKVAMLVAGSAACRRHAPAVHAAALAGADPLENPALRRAWARARYDGVPFAFLRSVVHRARVGLPPPELAEFDCGWEGEAYQTVTGQNANNTVRVTNAFMKAAVEGGEHALYWRTELRAARAQGRAPKPHRTVSAPDLFRRMCEATWASADPGINFGDTVNEWNTCPADGEIRATNPCQPGFAQVLTRDGIRVFDEIEVGAEIWTGQRWSRVVRKVATGVKPVRVYHTTAGRFVGTDDHRVFQAGERVPVADAAGIDQCRGPEYASLEVHSQDVIDGWVVGDGSYHQACREVYLNVGAGDAAVHTELAAYVVRYRPGLSKFAWSVRTTVTGDELPPLPVRTVPDRFVRGTPAKVAGFLRGLYSANGSICGGRITLKATSFDIVNAAQAMLSSLGIRSYYTTNPATEVEFVNGRYACKQSYDLNITADRKKFVALIGFVQPDKQSRAEEAAARPERPWSKGTYEVTAVETLGDMPVYDIEVESYEHAYWTDGLLVSNCSEYMFLDDTCCNLASLNAAAFYTPAERRFRVADFTAAAAVVQTVLDVTNSMAAFPSRKTAVGAYNYRTTGVGYGNLGALLMRMGLGYDTEMGRAVAASLTCLLHCTAYRASAFLAERVGPFPRFHEPANRDATLRVVRNHAAMVGPDGETEKLSDGYYRLYHPIADDVAFGYLYEACRGVAAAMVEECEAKGVRNAQVSCIAPTGTIGPLMDVDTTGCEPDFSLVKFKTLAGGGVMKIVNRSVPYALEALGYDETKTDAICRYITGTGSLVGAPYVHRLPAAAVDAALARVSAAVDVRHVIDPAVVPLLSEAEWLAVNRAVFGHMTVEGAPHLKPAHYAVFDCANRCGTGVRFLRPEAHVLMIAAIQPWLSGGASKTINIPSTATVEDVRRMLLLAWTKKNKCTALYRDASKLNQPLSSPGGADWEVAPGWEAAAIAEVAAFREGGPLVSAETPSAADRERLLELLSAHTPGRTVVLPEGTDEPPPRRRLPGRRRGFTQKAKVGAQKLYLQTGEYEDGTLGEIFLTMHKEGATFRSVMNCFAVAVSLGLQHGVPLEEFVNAFVGTKFEPNGIVNGEDTRVRMASSLMDYVFRELAIEYLGREDLANVPASGDTRVSPGSLEDRAAPRPSRPVAVPAAHANGHHATQEAAVTVEARLAAARAMGFGDICPECGQPSLDVSGPCKKCGRCGFTTGCS
jgi:ribonucleoside-diphosphate reductase alpha chain